MNNKYFEIYSKRINRFNTLIITISIVIISCFFKIQILPNPTLHKQINKAGYKHKLAIGDRGKILDRNNSELAITINKYEFWVNTNKPFDENAIVTLFSNTFNKNENFYTDILSIKKNYNVIEKNITDDEAHLIISKINNIKGLNYEKRPSRFYQYNQFASHAIGYMDNNGDGKLGIEKKLNGLLNGDTTAISLQKGAKGKYFHKKIFDETNIQGHDITLTIDIELQKILQEELNKAVQNNNAIGANGIIVNPHNGEILAMASIPDFNPNQYNEYSLENFNNAVISNSYEPGSTFKVLPLALILNDKSYSINDSIDCENGMYRLPNNKPMHDHEPEDFLSIKDILVYSSNIGISKLSESYNNKELYKLIKRFGFCSKTNIPLNNEATGKIRQLSNWHQTSKHYISIGQELSITNLQLAMAYSAIANGGILVKPSLIKAVEKNNAIVYSNINYEIRRVLNREISYEIKNMLKEVVNYGTGKAIDLSSYNIAGKTGTAQKFKDGHLNNYIATFASIFPADNPEFVMIVSIDEPEYGKHWANLSAVPASREIIKRMLIKYDSIHRNIAKKNIDDNKISETVSKNINIMSSNSKIDKNKFPDFKGKTWKEALAIAQEKNIILIPDNMKVSGTIINQSIKPGSSVTVDMICKVRVQIL